MERDPLGFVWRAAPGPHVLVFMLLLLVFPLGWLLLDLVRGALDDAVNGNAFQSSPFASFLRLQFDLPERLAERPLVVFPGVGLERRSYVIATAVALAAAAAAIALVAWALHAMAAAIETRAAARLRRDILGALVNARAGAQEEARNAAALAGEGIARSTAGLGWAVITPLIAGGAIALALLYAAAIDWRLAAAVAVLLAAAAFAWPARLGAEERAAAGRRTTGASLRRALDDLLRRLPAIRAHGTAPYERSRLERDLRGWTEPQRAIDRARAALAGATLLPAVLVPAVALGLGAWLALHTRITVGEVAAAAIAGLLATTALVALMRWRQDLAAARPLFEETARTLGTFQARSRGAGMSALPSSGALVARNASAYDPASGARISGIDLSIALPAHVALIGGTGSGAGTFAALMGGQLDTAGGELTYGGVDLQTAEPGERARRLAFAGGSTVLVGGSLRQNLLYGCPEPDSPEIELRLLEAATAVGLDRAIHARGLAGTVDPAREPKLAAALVEARRAVRAELAKELCEDLIEPFDPLRYNRHATIGENILFGVPLGDTFREANLPSHPFVRAILEAEGLSKPLAAMGLSIATSLVEIFADIPDGHPLFDRFSFFSASERGYFEHLVARQGERRRGPDSGRDRERLISLALRYSESRHRLGLLDADLEARLVSARAAFGNLLPTSLQPAIEFYDPTTVVAAASLQDNLLFGRVNHDRAGAEALVRRLVRRVLTERGLDQEVMRVGLDSPLDPRSPMLAEGEIAAVDIVRCLVRKPDTLIVEHAFAILPPGVAEEAVMRLRRAMVGRGLVVVLPELSEGANTPAFDVVIRFERGAASVSDRRRAPVVPAATAEPVA
ncbi:MAG TPA: ABC transporter ATP-binding protein [Beijerinckiaceae bacterium]|jgi:ABC-type multidrug transport system fused ATPase/permease subunit|nr:transporter ATP-binding protein [Microvirga sp.]HZB38024.1 ABC transporter ATP-binding protein [Beijerinckiaceae bacterium]